MSDDALTAILSRLDEHDTRTKRTPVYSVGAVVISTLISYATIMGKLEAKLDAIADQVAINAASVALHINNHADGKYCGQGG